MRNNWVYPVICLALLNAVLLGQYRLISSCLLLLWLVRISVLRQPMIIGMTIGLLICGIVRFGGQLQSDLTRRPPDQQVFKIQPDDIQVAGDQVRFLATSQIDHQVVSGFYRCQNRQEQRRWRTNWQPIILTGDFDFEPVQGATNRNEFDYARFLAQQKDCHYQIQVSPEQNLQLIEPQNWRDRLHSVRQKCALRLAQLPPTLSFHAQALLLGIRDQQGTQYQETLGRLGVIHLLSLSGLHVFYLLSLVRAGATYCRIPREIMNRLLLVSLPFYAVFTGNGTSVSRAIGLMMVQLLCEECHWRQSRLDSWSQVLGLNLLWQPYLLQSMGGQLSYLMAFALIYLQGQSNFKVCYWLNLISLPLGLRYTYRWHLLTILVNGAMVPIYLPVVLSLVGLAIVGQFVCPPLVDSCDWVLRSLYQLLDWLATLPYLTVTFGKIPLLPLLGVLVLTLLLMVTVAPAVRRRLRRGIILLYGLSFLGIHFNPIGRVIVFDIGQGDSILIQQPFNRHHLLIDTGGRLKLPQEKWQKRYQVSRVEKMTVNYLYSQGIDHLDAVALTHQDADHIGDLGQLLQKIKVNRVICAAGLPENQQFQRQIKPYLNQIQLTPTLADQSFKIGQQVYSVLAPVTAGNGTNADSLVITTNLQGTQWLFTGDLEQAGELDLLRRYPQLMVDYLKVGHHGSQTATAPAFVQRLKPKGALISASRHNRYQHPHEVTLKTLKQARVPYWVTAQSGMLEWCYGPLLDSDNSQIKTTIKDWVNDDN